MSASGKVLLSLLFVVVVGPSCLVAGQDDQNECVCVEYNQCHANGTIKTGGSGELDVRAKVCPGAMEVCCFLPTTPQPTGTPPPVPAPGGLQVPNVTLGGGCGRRRFPQDLGPGFKVTGGDSILPQTTFYGEAPWMVVILRGTKDYKFLCGGTLILPNVVLTAAHCVETVPTSELSVKAGEYDNRILNTPIPTQNRNVSRVIVHPDFNSGNLHNDIAVVILEQPMELNEVVDVICSPEQGAEVVENDCFVTGWGRNAENGTYQAVLSKVMLPLRTRDYCIEKLRTSRLGIHFRFHEGFICAGGDDKRDTCKGDGGGPLICPSKADPNKMIQMGVVAWGIGCGEGFPTVFTSVSQYLPWVQSQIS